MDQLQQILQQIQDRNARVEMNKAWETSFVRRFFIAGMTYVVAFSYMKFGLGEFLKDALMHAIVPMGGYLLSTFSLPIIRDYWMKNHYKKSEKTQ